MAQAFRGEILQTPIHPRPARRSVGAAVLHLHPRARKSWACDHAEDGQLRFPEPRRLVDVGAGVRDRLAVHDCGHGGRHRRDPPARKAATLKTAVWDPRMRAVCCLTPSTHSRTERGKRCGCPRKSPIIDRGPVAAVCVKSRRHAIPRGVAPLTCQADGGILRPVRRRRTLGGGYPPPAPGQHPAETVGSNRRPCHR